MTRADFLQSWLHKRQYARSHPDLKTYHEAAYRAYASAFGADLEVDPNQHADPGLEKDQLHDLLLRSAESLERMTTPFSGMMCASKEIAALYQKHKDAFGSATSDLRHRHLVFMLDLMELIWGRKMRRAVSKADIDTHGHPTSPAPLAADYW